MKINHNPKVGIIIPSYNCFKYLKKSIKSAIEQTYENIEILVIDDDSSDPDIKTYLKDIKNSKLRYIINETNIGSSSNFKKGISLLSKNTDWVIILGHDDFLDKNFIKKALDILKNYPQVKIIHGRQIFINEESIIKKRDPQFPVLESAEDYLFLRCLSKHELRLSSVLFNIRELKRVGGYPIFPSGMGTDVILIFALAFNNMLGFAKNAIIYIRIHPEAESATATNLEAKLLSLQKISVYCLQVYQNNPLANQLNKQRIMNYLKYYSENLSSGLLQRKYREVTTGKSIMEAKKYLRKIYVFCIVNKIKMPLRFLIIYNFFYRWTIDLNQQYIFKLFMSIIQRIDRGEKSLRHFLFKKDNLIIYLKESVKKFSLIANICNHVNLIIGNLAGAVVIKGINYCHSCGNYGLFYWNKAYESTLRKNLNKTGFDRNYSEQMIKRENNFCINCKSNFRTRSHAKTILKTLRLSKLSDFIIFLNKNPEFVVYETANYWIFRNNKLKELPNYIVSEYYLDKSFGQEVNNVRNEDLEKLSFNDKSVDLLMTSEILEHVVDLSKALFEIYRVLKFKGYHIFTTPVNNTINKTQIRAIKGANGEINHHLHPLFHGDDISSGVLVYRDFGNDIKKIIVKNGFSIQEEKYFLEKEYIFSVFITQKI